MAAFFLSYRRRDAPDMVGRLHDRITGRFGGASVFRDVDSIAVGDDFRAQLRSALDKCSTLIAIMGPGFLERPSPAGPDYVVEEIGSALERSLDVVPVLVHGAEMPAAERLPERIRELAFRQAARVRSDPDFAADAEKLLSLLAARVPSEPAGSARLELVLVSGPRKGARFPIEKERVLIGRSPSCDVCIEAPFASPYHAVIVSVPEGLFCRDLGSTNGTIVNGARVPRDNQLRLRHGDLIHVGSTILELRIGELREAGAAERLRVAVHIARFARTSTPCCFINVTNLSPSDVEVTHVWIDSTPPAFPTTPDRRLPKRLQPQESWETWIPLADLPASFEAEQLQRMARARLSTGTVVPSVANDSVPERGSVAGGPIREVP